VGGSNSNSKDALHGESHAVAYMSQGRHTDAEICCETCLHSGVMLYYSGATLKCCSSDFGPPLAQSLGSLKEGG
jgi:phosphosulfolactate phosphohydrolase-like enzyme